MRLLNLTLTVAAILAALHIAPPAGFADDLRKQIAAGEFSVAKQAAVPNSIPAQRDQVLAQIAVAQTSSGDPVAAGVTLRGIDSPDARRQAIGAARGGSSFADFDSLMQLIQQTVVPDTWEALGGPSTMAPYPQGVYVDPVGTVQPCLTVAASDPLRQLNAMLTPPLPGDVDHADAWMSPSAMRFISLRRLRDVMAERQLAGIAYDDAMRHMAGLSRIQYVILTDDDVIVGGPVGGIDVAGGWYLDRQSGDAAMRSDFLFACLASASANQPFGCTIDPTPAGMQQAAEVGARIKSGQLPIGLAAKSLQDALGMQRVEVFGIAGDTAIGHLMVEADRHMKQLALGEAEMPEGVKNYLDAIDATIAQGPPDELLLRLWFTARPQSVRADADRTVFEIAGDAIQLSGQNQRALATGGRGNVLVDPRTQMFVDEFNRQFGAIRDRYPVYAALESVYHAASAAQVMHQHADADATKRLLAGLAADATYPQYALTAPRQVESIATLHKVRNGRKMHHVLLASGGVAVDTRVAVGENISDYPTLTSLRGTEQNAPPTIQRWWWDR
ncbi:DUF1598 domain-containing protein [Stieleria varia]|uniref:DUF1598 domain-containing protein n=1 Tax=Stieleria varia TaxID=2528005 RepID=A0A5C6A1S3_9BACT|nr:DUF1598 domain-containing protein [Stieleria varia]TWT93802.1 hypothetical protein Pla52n_56300 [Stieleria varia]